jgi:hypothetical protein
MSKEDFELLFHKLDTIVRLLAGNLLRDADEKTEKVKILTELGISNKEITQIVGGSGDTVAVLKSRLKHKTRRVQESDKD